MKYAAEETPPIGLLLSMFTGVLLIAAVANSTAGVVHTLLQRGANPVSIRVRDLCRASNWLCCNPAVLAFTYSKKNLEFRCYQVSFTPPVLFLSKMSSYRGVWRLFCGIQHGFSPLNLSAGAALSPFEKSFLLLSHGSPPEPPLPSDAADKIVSDKAANAAARFALGWASKRKGPRLHDDVFFPSKEAIEESAATLGPPVFVQQSSDAPALLQATARGDIKLVSVQQAL